MPNFDARRHLGVATVVALVAATHVLADADVYMRDTETDSGVEPYTGPGPVYRSPDIWVLNEPDPNHDPYPFPTGSPPWTPQVHENPEYRDSKTGRPNYVYVRIHNRGDEPSTGTERLRLYQAKASTGLAWDTDWVDNVGPICGADRLLGIEVTKPRRNAQSVSPTERDAYRDALLAIQTDAQYRYSDGVQYWRKQNSIHAGAGNPEHGNPAFLAWHREMMNRYEERLREADPLVTLLYWDFTVDPRSGTNLFTTSFMGASSGTVVDPLDDLRPPTLTRNVGVFTCGFDSDASLLANGNYPALAVDVEDSPNHDCSHGYIGGGSGQISFLGTAAQDPFFFMLHANVDRQWANWQRQNAVPERIDPVAAYGSDASHPSINRTMSPWDGDTGLAPWTGTAAFDKTSTHRSVVFPPIYDTAPLAIPVLQPGESVVVEIPWYPPDVNDYDCGGQAGHFCLLARIETATSAPFGMTFAEGVNVGTNTRNNNNIAWKNVTIVDEETDDSALRFLSGTLVRNTFRREAIFEIALRDRSGKRRFLLPRFAEISLGLPKEIVERIRRRGTKLHDLEFARDRDRGLRLRVTGNDPRFSVPLAPRETFAVEFSVALPYKEVPRGLLEAPFHFDLEQRLDVPREFFDRREAIDIGGVRFTVDFARVLENRDRDARPETLFLQLEPTRERLAIDVQGSGPKHLSVGEPLRVAAVREGGDAPVRMLSLELDGREVAAGERVDRLSETVSFDKPGVHTILTRSIDDDGRMTTRRTRVLVSESIPPNAIITKPASGTKTRVGEAVEIVVETAAAWKRTVRDVSLYVKEGDEVATGLNLIVSPNYAAVETLSGAGPHTFRFTPKAPGMYMFQIGVVDDKGVTGVSRHAMIMVTE